MPVIRHGEHDRVDVVTGHQFPIIVVPPAVLVVVVGVDESDGAVQVAFVDVAGRDHLATPFHQLVGVPRALATVTNGAHHDALGRRGLTIGTQHAGGNN